MSDVSAVTKFFATANEGFNTTTTGIVAPGGNSVPIASATGLTNGSTFVGVIEPGSSKEQVFTGTVDVSGLQITGVHFTKGINVEHANGVSVVDYDTGTAFNMMSAGMQAQHKQSGAHGAVTADSVNSSGAVTSGGPLTANSTTILNAAVSGAGYSLATMANPYKFSVYRNSALNSGSSPTKVTFDTENFDTGNNFDSVTNFRFTAPVAGFYVLAWMVSFTQAQGGNDAVSVLYKNGSPFAWGNEVATGGGSGGTFEVQASANDYFEIFGAAAGTATLGVGNAPQKTWFSGFLSSAT